MESYAEAQAPGLVRRKPGKGEGTLSLSCSDKLARWALLGLQVGAPASALCDYVEEGGTGAARVLISGYLDKNCCAMLTRVWFALLLCWRCRAAC